LGDATLKLVPVAEIDPAVHDEMIARASAGTFLHTRRFLAYHGDHFRDVSLAVADEKGALLGSFPAAVDPSDGSCVTSHPGLTYGGVVHGGELRGSPMMEALTAICDHYAREGFRTLRYKKVPYIYDRVPAGDDVYALFRLGAARYRCDLLSTIDLEDRPTPAQRRRRSLQKALKSGVGIRTGPDLIPALWQVLEANLVSRHGVSPVHSAAEIAHLQQQFPDEIEVVAGVIDGEVHAGVVLFSTPRVVHAQYIASSSRGQELSLLDAVFDHCISSAEARGARYFDFGSSTEDGGQRLNEGLFKFKTEFGAGSVAQDFYDVELNPSAERKIRGGL
jgi:hypothetical protein